MADSYHGATPVDTSHSGPMGHVVAAEPVHTHGHGEGVHLPPLSIWPITMAAAITILGMTLVLNLYFVVLGLFLFVVGVVGWVNELLHVDH